MRFNWKTTPKFSMPKALGKSFWNYLEQKRINASVSESLFLRRPNGKLHFILFFVRQKKIFSLQNLLNAKLLCVFFAARVFFFPNFLVKNFHSDFHLRSAKNHRLISEFARSIVLVLETVFTKLNMKCQRIFRRCLASRG